MNGRRTAIGFTLVAAGSLAVLWFSSLPLGVPGEWEWDRAAPVEPLWLAVAPLAGGALLYFAFVWFGSGRIERCGLFGVAGWLAGLVVAGFTFIGIHIVSFVADVVFVIGIIA